MVNNEHIPFSFSINKKSLAGGTGRPAIDIQPSAGTIGPNSSLSLSIRFQPTMEREYNLNVGINVKKKSAKLSLNIKGVGYAVKSDVVLSEKVRGVDGSVQISTRTLSPSLLSTLDFGAVNRLEQKVNSLSLTSQSKHPINFSWNLPLNDFVSISPLKGALQPGQKQNIEISFKGSKQGLISDLLAMLTVGNEIHYPLSISGRCKKTAVEFSFLSHDFGACFAYGAGSSIHGTNTRATKILRVSNRERDQNISLDLLYEGKQGDQSIFEVLSSSSVLSPGETIEIPVTFSPKEAKRYTDTIPFEVNGLYTVNVSLSGLGTQLKLSLADASQSVVKFPQTRVGELVTKEVVLVNRSKKTTSLSLSSRDKVSADSLEQKYLSISPSLGEVVELKPRGHLPIRITYNPSEEMNPFSEEIFLQAESFPSASLFSIHAVCHGVGLRLNCTSLPFGAVVQNSSSTQIVTLENVGNSGLPFQWDTNPHASWREFFTISPEKGFVPAHTTANISVCFHPKSISKDIRFDRVVCGISGAGAQDQYITLTGECVSQTDTDAETVSFTTKVRSTISKIVKLKNNSATNWTLHPSYSNTSWSGAMSVEVKANSTADYTINYNPMSLTGENEEEGTLFFPLPDGTATLFKLSGSATPADAEDMLKVTVASKKRGSLSIPVKNWIDSYQRFTVQIEREREEESILIDGASTIDVPGLMERSFKLSLFSFTETKTNCVVRFVNETTGESLFYEVEITFEGVSPVVISQVLKSPIRHELKYPISLSNPLSEDVEVTSFSLSPECSDLFIALPCTIPAKSETKLDLCYRPLLMSEGITSLSLSLNTSKLGQYVYNLQVAPVDIPVEKSLKFSTSLGTESLQTFRFTSFSDEKNCKYECKVTGTEFSLSQSSLAVQPAPRGSDGIEVEVTVRYEPSAIGDVRDTLTVSSPTGGEYKCILRGHCEPPKPQGPLLISSGASASAVFKNVSDSLEEYNFSVDNDSFSLSKNGEKIAKKGTATIAVSFKPSSKDQPTTGKLLVTSLSHPGVEWVYYLQGKH